MSLSTILPDEDLLSTGSARLDLDLSGNPLGGFAKGYFYAYIGDSGSGKTFLLCTCLAEAANNPNFDEYELIFDGPEHGALMDFAEYFGERMAARVINPYGPGVHSANTTEFYKAFLKFSKAGPCIYVLDSMDALLTEEKKIGMGLTKAKQNSQNFPRMISYLQKSKSILVIISQSRDNIGFAAKYKPKTRGGGTALEFYAAAEIWTKVGKPITKTYNEKKRIIGRNVMLRIRKNRLTGRDRDLSLPILNSYGIDNIGSCIDYLIAENYASVSGQTLTIPSMRFKGTRTKLIHNIEQTGPELLLDTVHQCWLEIEEAITPKRAKRYN